MKKGIFGNKRGAALIYVLMALTVVAAVCVSITLVSTSLYQRTAQTASKEQAFLFAKMVGQSFASNFLATENDRLRNKTLEYMQNENASVKISASSIFNKSDFADTPFVNLDELTPFSYNASITLRLNKSKTHLFADVVVYYNGVQGSVTIDLSYQEPDNFDRNMIDLFSTYHIYSTFPDRLSFKFVDNLKTTSSSGATYIPPNVNLYNGAESGVDVSYFYLSNNVPANLTSTGDVYISSDSGTVHEIQGNFTAYGSVTLRNAKVVSNDFMVYQDLVIGDSDKADAGGSFDGTTVKNVYCNGSVTVYGKRDYQIAQNINAVGDVTVYNARVGTIRTYGDVRLVNCTCPAVYCDGTVTLEQNSLVNGTVQAGNLKVINSSIKGDVTVSTSRDNESATGSLLVQMKPKKDASEYALGTDTDHQLGVSASSKISVAGDLTILNDTSRSLTLYGKVYVNGGIKNPFSAPLRVNSTVYPKTTTIQGDLTINGGVDMPRTIGTGLAAVTTSYTVNYLIGLHVTGDVVCQWSIPVFSNDGSDLMVSRNGTSLNLDKTSKTVIDGSLYVAKGSGSYDKAGNFAYWSGQTTTDDFFSYDWGAYPIIDTYNTMYVNLNGASLGNIYVGSSASKMGSVAIWNGTVLGDIVAHDIKLCGVSVGGNISANSTLVGGINEPGNLVVRALASSKNDVGPFKVKTAVTINGTLHATGQMEIGCGVTLAAVTYKADGVTVAGGTARVGRDAYINGTIIGEVIMASGAMTVGAYADLVNNASALHAHGDLIVESPQVTGLGRNKSFYLSGQGTLDCDVGDINCTATASVIANGYSYTRKEATDDTPNPFDLDQPQVDVRAIAGGVTVNTSIINSHPDTTVVIDLTGDTTVTASSTGAFTINADIKVAGNLLIKLPSTLTLGTEGAPSNSSLKGYKLVVKGSIYVGGELQSTYVDASKGYYIPYLTVGTASTDEDMQNNCLHLSEHQSKLWLFRMAAKGSVKINSACAVTLQGNNAASVSTLCIKGSLYALGSVTLCKYYVVNGDIGPTTSITKQTNGKFKSNGLSTYSAVTNLSGPPAAGESGSNPIKKVSDDLFRPAEFNANPSLASSVDRVATFSASQRDKFSLTEEGRNAQASPLKWSQPNRTNTVLSTGDYEQVSLRGFTNTSGSELYDNYLSYEVKALNASLFVSESEARKEVFQSVTSWAGLGFYDYDGKTQKENAAYYRVVAKNYTSVVEQARAGKDMLVLSRVSATGSLADHVTYPSWMPNWAKNAVNKLLSGVDWDFEYRPVGLFFFESGYVRPEVLSSYKTKPSGANPDYYRIEDQTKRDNYRGNNTDETYSKEVDNYRWKWGGDKKSGALNDVVWTFFTCTNPAHPYTSDAKDLHIVLPKHTYMQWEKDKDSAVNIIGNGRVFLYLQEDTDIRVIGNGTVNWAVDSYNGNAFKQWAESLFNNDNALTIENNYTVFGGVRAVGVYKNNQTIPLPNGDTRTVKKGETIYNYDKDGNPVGVAFMDEASVASSSDCDCELQPRMYIIGTGPNITFEVQDFQTAAYVYMPNGYNYNTANLYPYHMCAYCGTRKSTSSEECPLCGSPAVTTCLNCNASLPEAPAVCPECGYDVNPCYFGLNSFIVSSSSRTGSEQTDVYGIYVADRFQYKTNGSPPHYLRTVPDLSDTIIYYKNYMVTICRSNGLYHLSEFWDYQEDTPISNYKWSYRGVFVQ